MFSAIMSTGRICPCLTEADRKADPAVVDVIDRGGVIDDGGGRGSAGIDSDAGQAENTDKPFTGKTRALCDEKT